MRDIKSCRKGKDLLFMHVAITDYCRKHSSVASTGMFACRPPNGTVNSVPSKSHVCFSDCRRQYPKKSFVSATSVTKSGLKLYHVVEPRITCF